ncbi:hypothetical protein AB0H34_45505 [Saccharopolyspora shandongensis]|uniref:hypothetical protein n=1 Tax=Saccharopolyspora shandongensis TaxID=418495 RepID=UPI003403F5A9
MFAGQGLEFGARPANSDVLSLHLSMSGDGPLLGAAEPARAKIGSYLVSPARR